MPLPMIVVPHYDVRLPSNGETVTIRPFLVKEEKLLLMAVESKDDVEIINTTKQVVQNCIIKPKINIDSLPFYDLDYLFIALRAKSIGEYVEVNFTCNNLVDGHVCGGNFPAKIDISNCKIESNPDISDTVMFGPMTIKLKCPNYSVMKSISGIENELDRKTAILADCIDTIVTGQTIQTRKDWTPEEMKEFLEGLTQEQFSKIETFADNFPGFYIESEAKCVKCGFQHKLRYTDFQSFFT